MTGSKNNGFFNLSDPKASEIVGGPIEAVWWSRGYEYPWALQYAGPGQVVADMGCGWHQRPLKDSLAMICDWVWAVDGHPEVTKLQSYPNMPFVVADIREPIPIIEAGSLDRVFCISVLEDIGSRTVQSLQEFARCVKPASEGGLCVITFDVQYDDDRALGRYPGVRLEKFREYVEQAGLRFVGEVDEDKSDAVFHELFNLCVFHCVLERVA